MEAHITQILRYFCSKKYYYDLREQQIDRKEKDRYLQKLN